MPDARWIPHETQRALEGTEFTPDGLYPVTVAQVWWIVGGTDYTVRAYNGCVYTIRQDEDGTWREVPRG